MSIWALPIGGGSKCLPRLFGALILHFPLSGEARLARARQADPLQARGRDHHRRHHQATPDRAGPQAELQGLRVLGRVRVLTAAVSEVRRLQGKSTRCTANHILNRIVVRDHPEVCWV